MTQKTDHTLTRRHAVAGLGTVGAAAAAVTLLPLGAPTPATAVAQAAPAADAATSGYQLTEHVRRYYQTART